MSDTPRTDDFYYERSRIPSDRAWLKYARQLERELAAANALLDCRAGKLLRKRKPFLVVADDEPYFHQVYSIIRARELEIGRWTSEDEIKYCDAIAAEREEMTQPVVKVAVWLGKDGQPYCSVADDDHAIASHATIVELVRDAYESDEERKEAD